jgi:hypothetical protein
MGGGVESVTSFLPNFLNKTTSVAKRITMYINLITLFGEFLGIPQVYFHINKTWTSPIFVAPQKKI